MNRNTQKYLGRLAQRAKLQQNKEIVKGDAQIDALNKMLKLLDFDMKQKNYLKFNTKADLATRREIEKLIHILSKPSILV